MEFQHSPTTVDLFDKLWNLDPSWIKPALERAADALTDSGDPELDTRMHTALLLGLHVMEDVYSAKEGK